MLFAHMIGIFCLKLLDYRFVCVLRLSVLISKERMTILIYLYDLYVVETLRERLFLK